MANSNVTCHACNLSVDAANATFQPRSDGNFSVTCNNCAGEKKEPEKTASKPSTTIPTQEAKEPVEKTKFFCGKCKYKFKQKVKDNLKCPYCGRADQIMPDNTDASAVLQEVSSPDFDEGKLF